MSKPKHPEPTALVPTNGSEFLLYQTEDGQTRIEVRFMEETLWLSQKLIADLFQKDVRTINELKPVLGAALTASTRTYLRAKAPLGTNTRSGLAVFA